MTSDKAVERSALAKIYGDILEDVFKLARQLARLSEQAGGLDVMDISNLADRTRAEIVEALKRVNLGTNNLPKAPLEGAGN